MISSKMIYLIRHAQSVYNIAESTVKAKNDEENPGSDNSLCQDYLNLKFDLKYEDCDITEQGVKQCEECRKAMAGKSVDLVIVSPMRRALATCYEVFKGHKDKPQIIVDPAFREIFESSCDIASRLNESMSEYQDFDYALIGNPATWYIEELQYGPDRQKLKSKLDVSKKPAEQCEQAKYAMLQYLKEMWEKRKEDPSLKQHVLPSVSNQKSKLKNLLQKYNSIAVVSHSENIKSYIGYKPPNCSITEFPQQYFELGVEEIESKCRPKQ